MHICRRRRRRRSRERSLLLQENGKRQFLLLNYKTAAAASPFLSFEAGISFYDSEKQKELQSFFKPEFYAGISLPLLLDDKGSSAGIWGHFSRVERAALHYLI